MSEEQMIQTLKEDTQLYVDIKKTVTHRKFKNVKTNQKLIFYDDMFKILTELYDNSEYSKDELYTRQWVTKELVQFLIPMVNKVIENANESDENVKFGYQIWEKSMALASRESFHHFLLYMELDRQPDRQVYSNRVEVLGGIVYYLNKMHNEPKFIDLIGSFPPSFGKSFVVNYFSAWVLGKNKDGSILRLSYSDDLLNGFSRSIKSLIMEERFQDVFPYFSRLGNRPFSKDKDSDWLIKGADTLVSHYTRTRDGAVTGVRAKSYIIFDDMTKGADEANNDSIHEKYWDQYMTEWRNRKDNDLVKEITIGTMWNPKDILSRKGEQLARMYKERPSKYKYINEYIDSKGDVRGVVIRVPLLDENNESTCEDIYSTETARSIKEETDEFLFSCVYQQDPISPTGRLFSYENLMTYSFWGTDIVRYDKVIKLSDVSYAVLDPVRKGIDNVAMPILKYDVNDPDKYYLVDVIFKGKSMEEVYDDILDKVIQHEIVQLVVENNTDTSLAELLNRRLVDRGYHMCQIDEKFNTVPKDKRIRDHNLPIKKQIVFPANNLFSPNTEMGKFMENLTRYSLDRPNKHDDAPDSMAMFVSEIIREGYRGAKVEVIKRPPFV